MKDKYLFPQTGIQKRFHNKIEFIDEFYQTNYGNMMLDQFVDVCEKRFQIFFTVLYSENRTLF